MRCETELVLPLERVDDESEYDTEDEIQRELREPDNAVNEDNELFGAFTIEDRKDLALRNLATWVADVPHQIICPDCAIVGIVPVRPGDLGRELAQV